MSTKSSTHPVVSELDDKQIIEYLRHHPDFFLHHLDLLVELELPHNTGDAVSLIERQVQILRQQRRELTQRLENLTANARENEALSEDLHQFMLVLLDADNLDDVFGIVEDYMKTEFDADAIAIRLVSGGLTDELVDQKIRILDDEVLPAFEKMLMAGNPSCEPLNREQLYYLFGEHAVDIASNVVIPLNDDEMIYGLLAIGSSDPERYQPEMGTIFLRRFGEFLTHNLKQFMVSG